MRIIILIPAFILLWAGITIAQSKPEAYKFAEFGPMSQAGVKAKMDGFMLALFKDPSCEGYIITYGTPKAVAARRKQITNYISFLKLDPSRVIFTDGGFEKKVRTGLWIMPPGAEPPKP